MPSVKETTRTAFLCSICARHGQLCVLHKGFGKIYGEYVVFSSLTNVFHRGTMRAHSTKEEHKNDCYELCFQQPVFQLQHCCGLFLCPNYRPDGHCHCIGSVHYCAPSSQHSTAYLLGRNRPLCFVWRSGYADA